MGYLVMHTVSDSFGTKGLCQKAQLIARNDCNFSFLNFCTCILELPGFCFLSGLKFVEF